MSSSGRVPGRRGAVDWSKHPNILELPGFQFVLNENGGIVSQNNRGMLVMLIPKKYREPSRDGIVGVAKRLQLVFEACFVAAKSDADVPLLSEPFWDDVFEKLKADNPDQTSFGMEIKYSALTAILKTFEDARRRFIDSGAVLNDDEMAHVLSTVDEWLKLQEKEANPLPELSQQLTRIPGARRIVQEHTALRAQKAEEAEQNELVSQRKRAAEGSPPPPFFFDVKRRKNDHSHVEGWDWLVNRAASMERDAAKMEANIKRLRDQLSQAGSRRERMEAEKQAMVHRIRKETNRKEMTERQLEEALAEGNEAKLALAEAEKTAARAVERSKTAEHEKEAVVREKEALVREKEALVREKEALIEEKEALAKDVEREKSVVAAEARKASVFDDRYRAAQQLYRNRVKKFESKLEAMEALEKENKALAEERDGLLQDVDMAKALTAAEAQKASVFDDRYKTAEQLYDNKVKKLESQIEEMTKESETLKERNV